MFDSQKFVRAVKQAALDAVDSTKPVNVCFGVVTQASPLQILVDQKLPLGEKQLVLSRNVTDFETKISMLSSNGWKTEQRSGGSGDAAFASHDHDINKVKHTITIHNGLVKGDEVILIRQQGGQKYIVVDRIG